MRARLLLSALVLFFLGVSAAQATTYCEAGALNLQDGATLTTSWRMTSSQARRIVHPAQTKPTSTCVFTWRVLGGFYRPIEILEKPRLNTAVAGRYALSYRALNLGHDRMVIRIYWLTPSNQTRSATVIYDIDVVGYEL